MPQISQFFGIVIYMYFNEHLPAHSMSNTGILKPCTELTHWT
jgi:hypothetical protein